MTTPVPFFIDSFQHWTQSAASVVRTDQWQAKWPDYYNTGIELSRGRYTGRQGLWLRNSSWILQQHSADTVTIACDFIAGDGSIPMDNNVIFGVGTGVPIGSDEVLQVALVYENQGAGDMAPGNLLVLSYVHATTTVDLLWRAETVIAPPDTWQSIEGYFKISATDGAVIVRIDGVEVINLTGLNTDPMGAGSFNRVALGWNGAWYFPASNPNPPTGKSTTLGVRYYDNLYMYGEQFFPSTLSDTGDRVPRISPLLPDGPGLLTEWSLGGINTTNWQGANRSKVTWGSFVSGNYNAATTDVHDLYSMQDTTTNNGHIIHLVQSNLACSSDSPFLLPTVRPLWNIGGTVYAGSTTALPNVSGWSETREIFPVNVATGAAWTDIVINAAQFGIECVSPNGATVYVTQTCLEVAATNVIVSSGGPRSYARIVGL